MMGTTGTGLWGVSSGWNGTPTSSSATPNIWGAPAAANTTSAFNTTDIWGGASNTTHASSGLSTASKKDDVFGDLWGDFK